MVCGDQHQICNPSSGVCSKLSGQQDISPSSSSMTALSMNAAQIATVWRLYHSVIYGAAFYQVIDDMGAQALQAQNHVSSETFSSGLPSDQWQNEASRWFEISLIKLQSYLLESVTNSWIHGNEQYVSISDPRNIKNETGDIADIVAAESYQCYNQVIRSTTAVQNFSLSGILVIVLMSCFIIGFSFLLEPIVTLYRKLAYKKSSHEKDLARMADDKYMLGTLALEKAGCEVAWKVSTFGIPITEDMVNMPPPIRGQDGLVEYHVVKDNEIKSEGDTKIGGEKTMNLETGEV
jgi:hypothetical protein